MQAWLPALLAGETIAAHVAADDLAVDGESLTGSSAFVSHGGAAGLFLVAGAGGSWLVRADAPGVTVTMQTTMDQTRPYARVVLDGVCSEPLADHAAAAKAATAAGMVVLAAEGLGLAQAALERTVAYARDRVQFGRAIGSFQAYKHRLADMMVEIEQARSAVYWAACSVDEGSPEAPLALHAAKSFAADTAFRCAADMIQLHGGIGFTWEHDAHLFFKRARALQTMMGKGDWHREQIAAMLLGEMA
jgi:alkylation response protein AidB-like acyl-CoA dehydrogenase